MMPLGPCIVATNAPPSAPEPPAGLPLDPGKEPPLELRKGRAWGSPLWLLPQMVEAAEARRAMRRLRGQMHTSAVQGDRCSDVQVCVAADPTHERHSSGQRDDTNL